MGPGVRPQVRRIFAFCLDEKVSELQHFGTTGDQVLLFTVPETRMRIGLSKISQNINTALYVQKRFYFTFQTAVPMFGL